MKTESGKRNAAKYEIKEVPQEAYGQADELWALAFNPCFERGAAHRMDTVYGAFKDERLYAVAGVVDMDLSFAGTSVPCAGISAVATMPGQRYQNLTTRVLTECLRDLNTRGVPISCLFPFSYPFYECMGWAMTHRVHEIEMELSALKKLAADGQASRWEYLPVERAEETLRLHRRMCQQFNLCLSRTAARCRDIAAAQNLKHFIHPDGYMLWDYDRSRNRKLYVLEFVYLNEQAYLDGLALIAQMDAQYDAATWFDWQYERLLKNGVPEPRPAIKIMPGMMSRVVNLKQFQKLLPQSLSELKVFDPLGISAPTEGDISVGEVLQLVTGTWSRPDDRFPANLHGIVAGAPVYSIERF